MKKWMEIILVILLVGISVESSIIEASNYSYDIKDEFRFSSKHSFNVIKNEEKAEDELKELKKTFDEVDDVQIKLEKTGTEGLDIFMAHYTGKQAEALNELYWNAHEPAYEAYWNDLVDELRVISKQISQEVGVYYGIGMTIEVNGETELILLVTGGLVMLDNVNPSNYDAEYRVVQLKLKKEY